MRNLPLQVLALGAVLILGAGCLRPRAWEYQMDGVSRAELDALTLGQYLKWKGRQDADLQAMSPAEVEKAMDRMKEEVKGTPELALKLHAFQKDLIFGRLNLLGADGWELVHMQVDSEGMMFLFKRPARRGGAPREMRALPAGDGPPQEQRD